VFEHLDDGTTPPIGVGQLASVLRRAKSIRTRRRVAALTATCVILLGALSGFIASRSSNVQITSTETAYAFDAVKGPLAVGTLVPTTALLTVVFTDAEDGFALAAHRGAALLAVTTNGGNSWQVQNDSLPAGYGQSAGYPGQIEFVGTHGYLWGGASDANGSMLLWVSDDSGLTWSQSSIGPTVLDVSAIGANVWAVTGDCDAVASSTCSLVTEQSSDWGSSWQSTNSSGLVEVNGPIDPHSAELARITLTHSYVLTSDGLANGNANIALFYTGDGGQTWQLLSVPCSGAFDLGAEVAASSTNDLWLLCGGQGSAGSQSKELYRSSNGGLNWSLAAQATAVGTPAPLASQPNSLPRVGYIAPFSIGHKNLAVLSATTAWFDPMGTSMYKTVDGGQSWSAVSDLESEGVGSGPGNVTFISANQGWICVYGIGLWHTANGINWVALGV